MLNIPLIRKVQESIANPKNDFDMTHWETCICGHLKHVVIGQPIKPWWERQTQFWALPEAVEHLGVSMPWAIETFTYGAAFIIGACCCGGCGQTTLRPIEEWSVEK